MPQRQGQRLAGGETDPHAGEQPRTDVDGDQAQLAELDVGLLAHELDRRGQDLGVVTAADHLEPGDHTFVAADGDTDLLRGGLDPEDQHDVTSLRSRSQRAAHDGPDGGQQDVTMVGLVEVGLQAHLEMLDEQRLGDVAPFDEHHGVISASSSRLRSATSLS